MKAQWKYERENVQEWLVRLYVSEEEGMTFASATLRTAIGPTQTVGVSRCHPADADIPAIGDELAAGRALVELGNLLIRRGEAAVAATRTNDDENGRHAAPGQVSAAG